MSEEVFKLPNAAEITEDVSFTEATIDDEMVRQPSLVAHYARICGEVMYAMDTAKQILEITESKVARQMRDEHAEAGLKITEAQIASSLAGEPRVMKARKAYNRAKADNEAARGALEAMRHKKDMMIQLAVGRRSEIESKIRGLVSTEKLTDSDEKARQARAAAKESSKAVAAK